MSMITIKRICKVDSAGNVNVVVPVGVQQAGEDVEVTVATLNGNAVGKQMTPEQWREFVMRTAGSIDDPDFKRQDQGYNRRK